MKILGISARKQGGKNSSANYLSGILLKKRGVVSDFSISEEGELVVLTKYEDGTSDWGVLDLCRKDYEFIIAAEQSIFPYTKNYSFADSLKELAVNLFELKPEQVWGTDEQKNSPTHLRWRDMPGVVTDKDIWNHVRDGYQFLQYHNDEMMTGREFLQFFGTEIGRRIHGPIWVNATINKIKQEQSGLSFVTDVRFPDEVAAIQKAGGKVIRLTRCAFPEDKHPSETSLDKDVYDWSNFDAVIDNQDLALSDTCVQVEKFAKSNNLI